MGRREGRRMVHLRSEGVTSNWTLLAGGVFRRKAKTDETWKCMIRRGFTSNGQRKAFSVRTITQSPDFLLPCCCATRSINRTRQYHIMIATCGYMCEMRMRKEVRYDQDAAV